MRSSSQMPLVQGQTRASCGSPPDPRGMLVSWLCSAPPAAEQRPVSGNSVLQLDACSLVAADEQGLARASGAMRPALAARQHPASRQLASGACHRAARIKQKTSAVIWLVDLLVRQQGRRPVAPYCGRLKHPVMGPLCPNAGRRIRIPSRWTRCGGRRAVGPRRQPRTSARVSPAPSNILVSGRARPARAGPCYWAVLPDAGHFPRSVDLVAWGCVPERSSAGRENKDAQGAIRDGAGL